MLTFSKSGSDISLFIMKNYLLLIGMLLSFAAFCACNSDGLSTNPLLGTWEMKKYYIGYDTPDERIYNTIGANEMFLVFQENGILEVKRKSEQSLEDYFLPSGNFTYSFTTDNLYLNTDNEQFSEWCYIVEDDKLSISLYRKMDMSSYP